MIEVMGNAHIIFHLAKVLKKYLLLCGLLSAVIYLAHVIVGGLLWTGYSHLQQPISDLTATGAPNRKGLLIFTILYEATALCFAAYFIFLSYQRFHRLVLWGGITFCILHLVSVLYSFFPEDLSDARMSVTGVMHIVVTAAVVPFTIMTPFLVGAGFRKDSDWERFGSYSIISGIAIVIFGGLSGLFFAKKLPYFGLIERVNIGTLQLWTALLSLRVFRKYD